MCRYRGRVRQLLGNRTYRPKRPKAGKVIMTNPTYNKDADFTVYEDEQTRIDVEKLAISYYQKALASGDTRWLPADVSCSLFSVSEATYKNVYERSSGELICRLRRKGLRVYLDNGTAFISRGDPICADCGRQNVK